MEFDAVVAREVVRRALDEDLGDTGDLTSRLCVPEGRPGTARILAKEAGIVAGLAVAELCFKELDDGIQVDRHRRDGDAVKPGDVLMTVRGRCAVLMAGERTALNFLQRMSGIATQARAFVSAVASTRAKILDTRKTSPGLRVLEKYAVRVGGGCNHRFGLYDQVLIKENHVALAAPMLFEDVVRRAVAGSEAPVIVEARNWEEALAAVRGGASVVMLDNMEPGPELRRTVDAVRDEAARLDRSVEIESSGGITLDNVRAYAACGVDRLSVGSLTHSVRALDLSMLVEEVS